MSLVVFCPVLPLLFEYLSKQKKKQKKKQTWHEDVLLDLLT